MRLDHLVLSASLTYSVSVTDNRPSVDFKVVKNGFPALLNRSFLLFAWSHNTCHKDNQSSGLSNNRSETQVNECGEMIQSFV